MLGDRFELDAAIARVGGAMIIAANPDLIRNRLERCTRPLAAFQLQVAAK